MNAGPYAYSTEALHAPDGSLDVRIVLDGRARHLGGRRGAENELRRVADVPPEGALPVLLGSGLGTGLADVLARTSGPVAVVDAEEPVVRLTGLRDAWRDEPRLLWIDGSDADSALAALTRWQIRHGGLPFAPVLRSVLCPVASRNCTAILGDRLEVFPARSISGAGPATPKFRSSGPARACS